MNQRELFSDRTPPAFANRLAAELVDQCQKCHGTEYVDHRLTHSPHDGNTVRRDCARCGWTMGFPEWYGEKVEVAR